MEWEMNLSPNDSYMFMNNYMFIYLENKETILCTAFWTLEILFSKLEGPKNVHPKQTLFNSFRINRIIHCSCFKVLKIIWLSNILTMYITLDIYLFVT